MTLDSSQLNNAAIIVEADSDRIKRVFSNLLKNSLTYTNEGGTVRVSYEVRAGSVHILFDDTEPGVPAEFIPRIFD